MKPVEKHHEREVLLEVRDLAEQASFKDCVFLSFLQGTFLA